MRRWRQVRILSECIAAAEGAVHSLAPRLLEAAAASGPRHMEMLAAAQALQAASPASPRREVVLGRLLGACRQVVPSTPAT